ncbi:MAG: DUF885 family protein [Planctomycetes bacterium]|nr:DUF885 family protein [Planctomycetota bacterium]
MRERIERYRADRGALERGYPIELSPSRAARLTTFDQQALAQTDALDFDALDPEARIDWLLLRNRIERELASTRLEQQRAAEMASLLPFGPHATQLVERARRGVAGEPEAEAAELEALRAALAEQRKQAPEAVKSLKKSVANRAAGALDDLRGALEEWYRFRAGYDPAFDWWMRKPMEALRPELEGYAKYLREDVAGLKGGDDEPVVGDPIGREALLEELRAALIPYTPEELIAIADKQFAWCQARMLEASREMGCGDDWKAALERVKRDHVAPGEQPALIAKLAEEASDFLESNELVTVPALCKESWRMQMMSPERQLVTPFFTGGEVVSVSFPTDSMTQEQKEMSMRGNNVHFSRATVGHELIPGHHLQGFMSERWSTERRMFATPFYTEGWALYWELDFWDRGFQKTPEDRIGALFWRMHRCARIRFSLGFHLGQLTPEQCVDMLVNEVGHERRNAAAEVRRSFNGGYGPLYQIAYMIGGLQLRALHAEVVGAGKMSEREFHDAVLQGGNMPIEMVRARIEQLPLTRDWKARWRFDG